MASLAPHRLDRLVEDIQSDPATASLPRTLWPVVCLTCRTVDVPRKQGPRFLWPAWFLVFSALGLLLWLFFVPAILCAMAWTMRKRVCAACGSDQIIPLDSPRARDLLD